MMRTLICLKINNLAVIYVTASDNPATFILHVMLEWHKGCVFV